MGNVDIFTSSLCCRARESIDSKCDKALVVEVLQHTDLGYSPVRLVSVEPFRLVSVVVKLQVIAGRQ